jgi:hypothetical protein
MPRTCQWIDVSRSQNAFEPADKHNIVSLLRMRAALEQAMGITGTGPREQTAVRGSGTLPQDGSVGGPAQAASSSLGGMAVPEDKPQNKSTLDTTDNTVPPQDRRSSKREKQDQHNTETKFESELEHDPFHKPMHEGAP